MLAGVLCDCVWVVLFRNAKKCRDKISLLEKELESLKKKIDAARGELEPPSSR